MGIPSPIPLDPAYVRYEGLFDFAELYKVLVTWAKNEGFRWHEKGYKHKVPSQLGAEQEISWVLQKNVDDFYGNQILIDFHTWDQQEIVVDDGKVKRSLTKARIEIKFQATAFYDYKDRFKGDDKTFKGKMISKLASWYWKTYNQEKFAELDPLHYRLLNVQALTRKYFDMQTKYNAYQHYLGED